MWPFPKRAKLPLIGLDQIALAAVADALAVKDANEVTIEDTDEPAVPKWGDNFATTPSELSPEYHADLSRRMINRLDADDARLTEAIAAEISQHETLLAALHAELAGIRKVREAYTKVGETLADPSPAPKPPRRRKPVEQATE